MTAGFTGRLALKASRLGRFVLASGDSGSTSGSAITNRRALWAAAYQQTTWVLGAEAVIYRIIPEQHLWPLPAQATVWRLPPEEVSLNG